MAAPPHELARLDALAQSRIIGTRREPEFDDMARLAAHATDSPMAMISFVDKDRLWLKAAHGLNMQELPREHSFCDAAVAFGQPFAVQDAAADARFANYVLVSSAARVRSYAAVPLHERGCALGTIAVLDIKPRELSQGQLEQLATLARQVIALLELRRLRDKRLLKTEALLASATRISGIGCWQWNMRNGEITWSNEMYDIFGLPRELTPSLAAFNERVHEEDRPHVAARTELTLQGQLTEYPDYRVVRPDGEVRVVQATAELERDAAGQPTLLTGALLDVTDRRRAEEERKRLAMQVMQGQKLESLGVLSAGVAHDFNNLLMGILGNAELAAADDTLSPGTRELMERVTESAIQAAGLTRQLLAYTGRGHLEMAELDLSAQVSCSVQLLRASLPSSLLLSSSLPRGLPAVLADGDQLQQIATNLMMNAAESYAGRSGEVRVRSYVSTVTEPPQHEPGSLVMPGPLTPGRYVVLEVADHGQGMTRETLERVFDPFFSTKFTGRGLGLAAVLGLTRAHRAILTVASEAGQGSCFRVYLPALEHAARAPSANRPEPARIHSLAGQTILVVDDEPRVRHLERLVLEGHGVTVLEAGSGDEAVALLSAYHQPVHLILLDLVMPGMDAVSTLRALRVLRPLIPVVIQSGYSEDEVTARLREVDEELAFLAKPFSPKTLIEKLSHALAVLD